MGWPSKEVRNSYERRHWAEHPNRPLLLEKQRKRVKSWRDKNPIKVQEMQERYQEEETRSGRDRYRVEVWFIYALDVFGEHKCSKCSERDLCCLQFDHINGGAGRNAIYGQKLYYWIVKHPQEALEKYQILCANCNWRKRWANWHERSHWTPIGGGG